MKNWYINAKKETNPEIKELMIEYDSLTPEDEKRVILKDAIISKLEKLTKEDESIDNPFVKKEPESKTPYTDNIVEHSDSGFQYKEEDIIKINTIPELEEVAKVCNIEIKRLEDSELKKMSFRDKKELNRNIWKISRIVFKARNKISLIRKENAEREEKANGTIKKLNAKRSYFINLYSQGISLTNIVNKYGFDKKELKKILSEEVIDKIVSTNDRNFKIRWDRWQKINLKKEN